MKALSIVFGLGIWLAAAGNLVEAAQVEVLRTPNEGIQPQAAVDAKGVLHLVIGSTNLDRIFGYRRFYR